MLKKKNEIYATVLAAILCIVGVIYGLYAYNKALEEDLKVSVHETLIEVTHQQKFNFNSKIDADISSIKNLAFMASSLSVEEDQTAEALDILVKNSNFEYISLANMQGEALLSSGETIDISHEEYFIHATLGETGIYNPKKSMIRDAIIVPISTPIVRNGEIIGVMVGSYTTENLRDLFLPSFGGNGFVYVRDSMGNVLVNPENESALSKLPTSENDAFDYGDVEIDMSTVEEIRTTIQAGETGYIQLDVGGQSQLVCYSPTGVNDWSIFVIVPESYIAASAILIAGRSTAFAIIIIAIFLLFLFYAFMMQHKGWKEREKHTKELEKLAYYDEMTGLPNLTKFKTDTEAILKDNPQRTFVMAQLDIVNFKMINEIFGFDMGDKVVVSVADHIVAVQKEKGLNIGSLTRINADEFLLMDISESNPNEIIQRIKLFEEKFNRDMVEVLNNHRVEFRYSGYFIEKGDCDITGAIEKTNIAHSMAKTHKKHQICFYDDLFKERIMHETEIENQMDSALTKKEFKVYLQPKYDLRSEKVVGAEALVRWKNAKGEVILPNDFIPLFERNGFIVKLDFYMFECVCEILKDWKDQGKAIVPVSVNFSRAHLSNPNFVNQLDAIANRYGVCKKFLEIELTESIIMDNEEILEELLNNLHNVGFLLSMDDFGIGYSSLGLLKNLPVDIVKIDRSFFVNNRYKSRAKIVIESVMSMAKKLEILTVAEGVESKEHIDLLKEVGCDVVQGFYYQRPIPFEEFYDENRQFVKEVIQPKEPLFDIHLIGNIEDGRGPLGNEMPVAVYRLFQFTLRETLNRRYGEGEAFDLFRVAGEMAGRAYAREYLDLTASFDSFIIELTASLISMKIGILTVEEINEEKSSMILAVRDDLDCSGTVNLAQTLCQYDEGFIAGLLYEYTHQTYVVQEIDCWGTGSDVCRFQVKLK